MKNLDKWSFEFLPQVQYPKERVSKNANIIVVKYGGPFRKTGVSDKVGSDKQGLLYAHCYVDNTGKKLAW